jgi:hypothetical protein
VSWGKIGQAVDNTNTAFPQAPLFRNYIDFSTANEVSTYIYTGTSTGVMRTLRCTSGGVNIDNGSLFMNSKTINTNGKIGIETGTYGRYIDFTGGSNIATNTIDTFIGSVKVLSLNQQGVDITGSLSLSGDVILGSTTAGAVTMEMEPKPNTANAVGNLLTIKGQNGHGTGEYGLGGGVKIMAGTGGSGGSWYGDVELEGRWVIFKALYEYSNQSILLDSSSGIKLKTAPGPTSSAIDAVTIDSRYLNIDQRCDVDVGGNLEVGGTTVLTTVANGTTGEVLIRDPNTKEVKKAAFADVCFLPGTKITLFDKIRINIENLQKGDSLLSYKLEDMDPLYKSVDVLSWFSEDDTGEFIESIVENIWTDKSPGYIILNDNLHVTHEHLIFTQVDDEFTWLSAKNIRKGDIVFTDKGEYEEIKKIKKVQEEVTVYNLRVRSDAMNYFADSYLVHNASLCDECAGKKGL